MKAAVGGCSPQQESHRVVQAPVGTMPRLLAAAPCMAFRQAQVAGITLKVGGGISGGNSDRWRQEATSPASGSSTPIMMKRPGPLTNSVGGRQGTGLGTKRPEEGGGILRNRTAHQGAGLAAAAPPRTNGCAGPLPSPHGSSPNARSLGHTQGAMVRVLNATGNVATQGARRLNSVCIAGGGSGETSPTPLSKTASASLLSNAATAGVTCSTPQGSETQPRPFAQVDVASSLSVLDIGQQAEALHQRLMREWAQPSDSAVATEKEAGGASHEHAPSEVSTGYADTHGPGGAVHSEASSFSGATAPNGGVVAHCAGSKDLTGLRSELERLRLQAQARKESKVASLAKCQAAVTNGPITAPSAFEPPLLEKSEVHLHVVAEDVVGGRQADTACQGISGGAEEAVQEEGCGHAAVAVVAGGGTGSTGSGGFQQQLDRFAVQLREEQRGKDHIASLVKRLEHRLNEGLASIGEVAQARMATDNATDTMLNALRKCVDELSEQCAWPSGHTFHADAVTPSLADVVLLHDQKLKELVSSQHVLIERQQRQLEHLEHLVERQQRTEEEHRRFVSGTEAGQSQRESLERTVEALSQRVMQLESVHEQRFEELQANQKFVRDSIKSVEEKVDGLCSDDHLSKNIRTVEAQLSVLQAEKNKVTDVLHSMNEQQQSLRVMQLQVLATDTAGEAVKAAVEQVEQQLVELRGERNELSSELQTLKGEQRCFQSAHEKQEDAVKAALEKLSEQVAAAVPTEEVRHIREEVAATAEAVNLLFGRVNEINAEEQKTQLRDDINALAAIVRKLVDRVERMEHFARIDRAQREPRSSDVWGQPSEVKGRHQHRSVSFGQQGAIVHSPWCRDDFQVSQAKPPKEEDEDAEAEMDRSASVKVPSPRKWLQEPLSVALARTEEGGGSSGNFPSSLQPSTLQQSMPNLSTLDTMTRNRADRR